MTSRPTASPSPHPDDVVADRARLLRVAMASVGLACLVFGVARLATELVTGRATPWWANLGAAALLLVLGLWYRGAPAERTTIAVHATALLATVALLIPAAYGLTSSKWWLTLVGFATLLMGRRSEGLVWSAVTIVLVPLTAAVEPFIQVDNAIGESLVERSLAGLGFVVLLFGMTRSFRAVADVRARELAATAQSLERSNRVRSHFLAHMSHELRTPLHSVIATTDLARSESTSPEVKEQLGTVLQSARALLGLLNDILDATRAGADAIELDARPFSVHRTVRHVLLPLAAEAREKGVTLSARAAPLLRELRIGDRVRLAQIVRNLVANAVKFTGAGTIDVDLRAVPHDADLLEIAVVDTGPGVPPDQLDAIFEPFTQARESNAVVRRGAGLGLALVRELLQRMDGSVRIESELGVGTTFTARMRVPVEPSSDLTGPEDLLAPETVLPKPSAPVPTRSLKALVCEDDPTHRKLMKVLLTRLGHDVTVASDGSEGWEMVRAGSFDILLTDIQMPLVDGVELAGLVRSREAELHLPRLPIVAVTAHVGEDERHRLLAAGIDAHLPKPFTREALALVLASFGEPVPSEA